MLSRSIFVVSIIHSASGTWCGLEKLGSTCPSTEPGTCGKSAAGAYACLNWREVQCATGFDLSNPKADGSPCSNAGESAGKCKAATTEGLPDTTVRCLSHGEAECIGKSDGAVCNEKPVPVRSSEDAKGNKDVGQCRVNNKMQKCIDSDVFACEGKAVEAGCRHMKREVVSMLYRTLGMEDSRCAEMEGTMKCVGPALGACVGKFEGQPCRPYAEISDVCQPGKSKQKNTICEEWDIVQTSMQDGNCVEDGYHTQRHGLFVCKGAASAGTQVLGTGSHRSHAPTWSVLLPSACAALGAVLSL